MPFIPPAGADPEVVKATLTGDSSVFPLTFAEVLAPLAARGEKPPKILATNVEGDYFRRRLSLLRTGATGTAEAPLPEAVRVWDIAGGTHGIIYSEGCDMPRANLDWHPLLRAGLTRLTRWVSASEPPPATRLIALVPSQPFPYLAPAPADLRSATMMVPRRDADGNAEGGVRLPQVAVPLGTFGGWNAPLETTCGDMSGYFHPFPRTRFQRLMTGDTRASLEERYGTPDEYMRRVTAAAQTLVANAYLLDADAKAIVEKAGAARPLFPQPKNRRSHEAPPQGRRVSCQ